GVGVRFARRRERWDAAVRRLDHERRVAERARAPFIAQERLFFRRAILAALLLARALVELLGRQLLAPTLILGTIARDATHGVDAPLAVEARSAPRRARRFPLRILHERRGRLGRNRALGVRRRPRAVADAAAAFLRPRRRRPQGGDQDERQVFRRHKPGSKE